MKRYLLMLGLVLGCVAAGYAMDCKSCCDKDAASCKKQCCCDDCGCAKCGKDDGGGRRQGHAGQTYKR